MKKSKKSVFKSLITVLLMTLITAGSFGAFLTLTIDEPDISVGFAAGKEKRIPLYASDDDGSMHQLASVVRGSRIKKYASVEKYGGKTYCLLKDPEKIQGFKLTDEGTEEDRKYYIAEENSVLFEKDAVKETEVYIRTPSTVYKDAEGPAIASFAEKGSCLKVIGYDKLLEDGSVCRYKVTYGEENTKDGKEESKDKGAQGYVYGKYTVSSQEEADAVYNENGVYDKIKKDKYGMNLYAGEAADLDYYPVERPAFKDNAFCDDAKAMYINGQAAVKTDKYTKLIKQTDCNAVVIDIKDGYLAYKSDVAKKYSPRSYKSAYSSADEYKKGIDAYKNTGAYLIGRIVVFNDALYAKDHPEDCIKYKGESGWPSAYSRNVWEYNVRLALEAVDKFGFNEIQFDYVRFPENAYEMSRSGKAKFRNNYDEEKGQAVQNFCIYAADMLHEKGAYMSVDVFGESAYGYMTAYGQYWPGISNVVDAISAMPYTDHMGADNTWEDPYSTMLAWSKKAKKQQDKIENPAAARTWITGYDTPYWNPTVVYGSGKLKAQVKAINKAGLSGGFIPWNSSSDISKYKQYKDVWN